MFNFIGTFIDGPLAGSSFEAVTDDGGSGGGILGLIGVCTVGALMIAAIACVVLSPFLTWALILEDVKSGTASSIVAMVILFAIEFLYILFRVRSNIRHWNASFVREVIYGTLFYMVIGMIICFVAIIPMAYILVSEEMGSYLIGHYGEWVELIISSVFHQFIAIVWFFGSLSVIPSLIIKGVSSLFINKAAKAAKVKP